MFQADTRGRSESNMIDLLPRPVCQSIYWLRCHDAVGEETNGEYGELRLVTLLLLMKGSAAIDRGKVPPAIFEG